LLRVSQALTWTLSIPNRTSSRTCRNTAAAIFLWSVSLPASFFARLETSGWSRSQKEVASRKRGCVNARKLKDLFGRDLSIVHNPTHGLIADLVETVLQKFTNVNTEPSAFAFVHIANALADPAVDKVVVIAHSQGTVIMGDVLDLLYYAAGEEYFDRTNMNPEDVKDFLSDSHGTMKSSDLTTAIENLRHHGARDLVTKKLELYMFANAASKMCYLDEPSRRPHIESFANEHDVVARLGCLAADEFHEEGLIRIDGPLFVRRGQYGHFMNAHYLRGLEMGEFELLRADSSTRCMRRSVHQEVRCNPCGKNRGAVPGDQAQPSRLLHYLRQRAEAEQARRPSAG
jgi:hypothetical protein